MVTKQVRSSERAPDPRPARTRAAILEAIEYLGASNAEISVAAIVAQAGLSRSSFYSQFNDVGDVAVQLVREVYDKLEASDAEARGRQAPREATISSLKLIIGEFSSGKAIYAAVLGGGAGVEAHVEVRKIMAEGALKAVGQNAPAGVNPEFAAHYLAGAVLASILHWVLDETSCDEEFLLDNLITMLPDWVTGS